MKKLYVMAFIAVATVVMVGCKPDEPKPTEDLKVVLDKHELELSEGEQGKLRAEISPAKEGIVISFRSENEEIVTVDASGLVSGIAAGVVKVIASAECHLTYIVYTIRQAQFNNTLSPMKGIVTNGKHTARIGCVFASNNN